MNDIPTPAGPPRTTGEAAYSAEYAAVEVIRDVRIRTREPGVTLAADLFLPAGAHRPACAPALVTLLPYRKDAIGGLETEPSLRYLAARGYAGVLVDLRGTGSSDGEQRPPFDAGEAEDGLAAVEWAADQPWCDGTVGMWGGSYGAITALRTAARRPPALKAVIAVMGFLDPERDFVHPDGARGCLGPLGWGASTTLLNQLLPPLRGYGQEAEQQRWRRRLHRTEPWLLDLLRHGPGDPAWRSRAVDVREITIPVFCVTGWRDLNCAATIRTFEQLTGPKRLLVGPWMHTMPEASPFGAIDFPAVALRWWDHWLKGAPTGMADEPPVTLYVQGDPHPWRRFESWSPAGGQRRFGSWDGDAPLTPSDTTARVPDPTVGALGGLCGLPSSGTGLPLDQHGDDVRSLGYTGGVLREDLILAGRPAISVRLEPGPAPGRIVARLAHVDDAGRVHLITLGVLSRPEGGASHDIVLSPTAYRIPAGHRLRVVLGDADFPRLWPDPASGTQPFSPAGVALSIPVPATPAGIRTALPQTGAAAVAPRTYNGPQWTITRDLIADAVRVDLGGDFAALTPESGHFLRIGNRLSARVVRAAPAAATVTSDTAATVETAGGERIEVHIELRMTGAPAAATG
jgi:putative CocE/NonD family hydrolase